MTLVFYKKGFSSFLIPLILLTASEFLQAQKSQHSLANDDLFHVHVVTDGLEHPWGMAFLPDKRILVTERPGRLRIVNKGHLEPTPILGLPKITASGQGGLLDIILHPDYKKNHWIYFSYVAKGPGGIGTEVARAKLEKNTLTHLQVIFRLAKKTNKHQHFGSRLVFDKSNYLYISLGDRGSRPRSQQLDDHAGSIIRLHDDGRIPETNPFIAKPFTSKQGIKAEIYSYGHRNPQGLAMHPETGEIWSHEHGPQGGDELNLIKSGRNYGWPVITYGVNYGFGTKIGEGTHKKGMQQPNYYWVPSIAPSGFMFYSGKQFPNWKNNLFIGSLKFQQLVRLVLRDNKVINEERFFTRKLGRIRDVKTGPEGNIFLLTDASNGKLIRLAPQ